MTYFSTTGHLRYANQLPLRQIRFVGVCKGLTYRVGMDMVQTCDVVGPGAHKGEKGVHTGEELACNFNNVRKVHGTSVLDQLP